MTRNHAALSRLGSAGCTKAMFQRLETIFEQLGESPKGKKCKGMEGLIEEGSEAIEEHDGAVLDAALIGAAQRVEHCEMAGYGTVIAFAEELGESKHVCLLKETLEEEKATDEKLTGLAGDINAQANQGAEAGRRRRGTAGEEKISQRGISVSSRPVVSENAVPGNPPGTAFYFRVA